MPKRSRRKRRHPVTRLGIAIEYARTDRTTLAAKARIAPGLIGRYLDGSITVGIKNALVLAPLLRVRAAWLAGLDDEMGAEDPPPSPAGAPAEDGAA